MTAQKANHPQVGAVLEKFSATSSLVKPY